MPLRKVRGSRSLLVTVMSELPCATRKASVAMAGTSPDNPEWIRRKSNCVRRFNKPSYALTLRQTKSGKGFAPDDAVDPMEIAAHGGSFPIRIEGVSVVGTITVSGVPGRRDHGYVVEAICEHLGIDYAPLALPPE